MIGISNTVVLLGLRLRSSPVASGRPRSSPVASGHLQSTSLATHQRDGDGPGVGSGGAWGGLGGSWGIVSSVHGRVLGIKSAKPGGVTSARASSTHRTPHESSRFAVRPVPEPILHTPLLGRPSGRTTEGDIRRGQVDLGAHVARWRIVGCFRTPQGCSETPLWAFNQRACSTHPQSQAPPHRPIGQNFSR